MKVNGQNMNKLTPAALLYGAGQGVLRVASLPFYAVAGLFVVIACGASVVINSIERTKARFADRIGDIKQQARIRG